MSRDINLILSVLCLTAHVALSIDTDCDKAECQGPIKYYEALGCQAVYREPGDCCPYKYQCNNESRPADKCQINGREYSVGEALREEDANPCDFSCVCTMRDNVAQFSCAEYSCPVPELEPHCYVRQNATSCCPDFEAICPKSAAERPSCEVEGKTYMDGEYFTVDGKECYCGPGFTGEYVEPFCRTPKQGPCSLDLHYAYYVKKNCVPVFYESQDPQTSCAVDFRCANERDAVVKRGKNENISGKGTNENNEEKDLDSQCNFGNMTLRIGDSLRAATDYDSVCVDCTCETGPLVTCRRQSYESCDPTKHEDFSKYRSMPLE